MNLSATPSQRDTKAFVSQLISAHEDLARQLLKVIDDETGKKAIIPRVSAIADVLDADYASRTAEIASLLTSLELHCLESELSIACSVSGDHVSIIARKAREDLVEELQEDESLGLLARSLGSGSVLGISGYLRANALCLLGRQGAAKMQDGVNEACEEARGLIESRLGAYVPETPVIVLDSNALSTQMRRRNMEPSHLRIPDSGDVIVSPDNRMNMSMLIHEHLHVLEGESPGHLSEKWWYSQAAQEFKDIDSLDERRSFANRISESMAGLEHLASEGKTEFITHSIMNDTGPPSALKDDQYRAYYSSVNESLGLDEVQAFEFWTSMLHDDESEAARKIGKAIIFGDSPDGTERDIVRWATSCNGKILCDVARIARIENTDIESAEQLKDRLTIAFTEARLEIKRPPLDKSETRAPSPRGIQIPGIDI